VATKPGVAASVVEIAVFAHVRRKWFDLYEPHARRSPERRWIASANCTKSRTANPRPISRRASRAASAVRRAAAHALHAWMIVESAKVDKESTFATAFIMRSTTGMRCSVTPKTVISRSTTTSQNVRAGAGVEGKITYFLALTPACTRPLAINYSLIETAN